jgi:hypothetical protein
MKHALIIKGVVDTITLSGQQDGWVQVPDDVFGGFTQNADGAFSPPAVAPPSIEDIRADASIDKGDFCKQLIKLEVLSRYDGIEASKGNWPNAMDEFLEYMNSDQKVDAQIDWSTAQSVERMHWLVLFMISMEVMAAADVDVMFGL